MRTLLSLSAAGVAAAVTIATPIPTSAECSGLAEIWGNDQIVTLVESDTRIGPGLSFFAHGPALFALWNESGPTPVLHTAGSIRWAFHAGTLMHELGHSLGLCHGGAVNTSDGQEILFVTSDNGRLYKLNAQTGVVLASVDTRRPGCLDDAILAPPTVQLFFESDPAFQGAILAQRGMADDLVYVVTATGCGDHTHNRVIAYWTSNLALKWEFNATGSNSMDSAKDGCEIDYGSNVLYCGTDQASPLQNTLWKIQTLTGSLLWAHNAGSIQNRPTLNQGPTGVELYVASTDGAIQKRNPADGSLIWAYPTGSAIVRSIHPEPKSPTRIFYTTTDGLLHAIMDNFPAPVPMWPPVSPGAGLMYTTAPAVAHGLNQLYVGRSDGTLQQVSLDGAPGPVTQVGPPGTVFDPSLDVSSSGAPDIDRLMVSTTEASVKRFCVPFGSATECSGGAEIWGNDMVVTPVESDTPIGPGLSFFAHGPALFALWNEGGPAPVPHAAGSIRWAFEAGTLLHELGHNLGLGHGGPVNTSDGLEILFVTSDNGRLYKLNAQTGVVLGSVDTRRPGCLDDKILAPPTVQLFFEADPVFQSTVIAQRGMPDDLVYVATATGCDDHTHNRVYAYWSSNLELKWEFNATGVYSMGSTKNGCEIDYGSNVLYSGTDQSSPGQNTLWAINTLTGSLQWSQNAGSILNRPQLNPHPQPPVAELYVASSDLTLQKRNPADGSLIWAYPTGSPIVRSVHPEPKTPTRIFYTTTDGLLHGIMDNFPAPVPLWPPLPAGVNVTYTTAPAVAHGLNLLYVGRSDGTLEQVTLDGTVTQVEPVGPPGTVFDPSLDVSSPSAPDFDRLMVSTTEGTIKRFCLPWATIVAVPGPLPVVESLLGQNAPNPFSAHTRIAYRLPYDAQVEIGVYDLAGHRVRTLVSGQQEGGPHQVTWDGLDDAGRSAASGLYLYRLRALAPDGRSFQRAKKVELVR